MPDSNSPAAPGSNPAKAKKAPKSNVPKADANFSTTVTDVNTAWVANPHITLAWLTQAEFAAKASLYSTTLGERKGTGAQRPAVTSDLKIIDKKLDEGIDWIKSYLGGDFGKNATAQYAKFGIEKVGSHYKLPVDRDKRQKALALVLPALAAQGYNGKEFGKAYFTPLITNFNNVYGNAKTTDSNVSGLVSDKNVLKAELTKALKCLIKVLEGNYPDTFKATLRKWGFQKEKY